MAGRASNGSLAAVLLALASLTTHASAADAEPCGAEPVRGWLDFWIGTWTVCAGAERAGEDRVERILDGCAIAEHWTDASGGQGLGLFFVSGPERTWKQVWVTDAARRPGGTKEKHLLARWPDGRVRFQGEIVLDDGRRILDRTTLGPRADGSVAQRIEISRDGGERWTTTFEAIYRRRGASGGDTCA